MAKLIHLRNHTAPIKTKKTSPTTEKTKKTWFGAPDPTAFGPDPDFGFGTCDDFKALLLLRP